MTPTYRIRDWSKHFENNRTRELKELRFVILPNKHDGDGYTELLDHPNGAAHYGAWCSIVQVASKGQHPAEGCDNPAGCCECRGVLLREGARPHDPASLSRLTRIPPEVYAEVLPRLVGVGWLEISGPKPQQNQDSGETPQEVGSIPHPPAESCGLYRMEGNGIEERKERQQRAKRTPETQGSRLPEDFSVTTELREWAKEHAPRVDLETTLAEFHDYWKGVPGAKGRKLDWPATFRNRLRELEGRKNGSGLRALPEHPNAYKPGKMIS